MAIKILPIKLNYPFAPFLIIFCTGFCFSMYIRLLGIEQTSNIGIGNLLFVSILFFWSFSYWALVEFLYKFQKVIKYHYDKFQQKVISGRLPKIKENFTHIGECESILQEEPLIENFLHNEIHLPVVSEINQEEIVEKQRLSLELKEKQFLDCFLIYSRITMANHVLPEQQKKLENKIILYSEEQKISNDEGLIQTKNLSNDDLINFGYNMANHFKYTLLIDFVPHFMNIFVFKNKPLDISSVRGKFHFRSERKNYKINCIKNIAEYLESLNRVP